MAALKWDQEGQKIIEAGVDRGVLYVYNPDSENLDSKYCPGEAWNGLTAVNESPSGADASDFYANNSLAVFLVSIGKSTSERVKSVFTQPCHTDEYIVDYPDKQATFIVMDIVF